MHASLTPDGSHVLSRRTSKPIIYTWMVTFTDTAILARFTQAEGMYGGYDTHPVM